MEPNDERQGEMGRSILEDTTSYLRASDFELEDEEEDHELPEDFWYRTHLVCASCEEYLHFDEETIAVVVVQGQYVVLPDDQTGKPKGRIEFYAVLDEEEDFAYEPILLHFNCWEELGDEFQQLIADEPRLRSGPTDICLCHFCHKGIGPFQEFARVILGELIVSERRKQTTFKEVEGGSPEPVCLECMGRINEQCIELWKS